MEVISSIFNSHDERFNCHMPNSAEKIDLDKKLIPMHVMTEGNGEERR